MLLEVFLAALISDLATGLGVLPFVFIDRLDAGGTAWPARWPAA